ncbi:sugar phosphate isomerase/epimerase [Candidatus Woesearchaeota archaeon]|nr:sugar phosphate isomerase/epimerase [Candidatus Woesearchaeota archaeon]
MIFNTVYYQPMDRRYDGLTTPQGVEPIPMPHEGIDQSEVSPESLGVGVKDIGMSVPLGIAAGNVEGVAAKLRSGIVNIEIGFPTRGRGNRQAQTPELYSKEQRQALKEIKQAMDVNFTTHAAYNVWGMTGYDVTNGRSFSRVGMTESLNEVRRAIDFASDVAGGGSVVVHTGEFERPLTQIFTDGFIMNPDGSLNRNYSRDEQGRLMFRRSHTEANDFAFQLIDERSGELFTAVQGNKLVAQPKWLKAKKDYKYFDDSKKEWVNVKTGDYINYQNEKVEDPFNIEFFIDKTGKKTPKFGRVPEYDEKTGRFVMEFKHHDDFEREAQEYNNSFKERMGHDPTSDQRMTGREIFLINRQITQASYSRGWSLQYSLQLKDVLEQIKQVEYTKKYYEEVERKTSPDEAWKILEKNEGLMNDPRLRRAFAKAGIPEGAEQAANLMPPKMESKAAKFDRVLHDLKQQVEQITEMAQGQDATALEQMESAKHFKTPEKYVFDHGVRGYAYAGIHAMKKTKDPNNPIFISMENLFPERYGGHPQEFKHLIMKSRDKMAEMLTKPKMQWEESDKQWFREEGKDIPALREGFNPYYIQGLSKEEAKKIAEKHIKATLDTGHLNMWRKYYVPDPRKSDEQNEQGFKDWYLHEVEDLAKAGVIGNVHLVDNFGYEDEHLSPGQGNTPVKEVVQILKKYGYNKALTIEPGAAATTDQSDFHGLMSTWRYFGSQVYGMGGPTRVGAPPRNWVDVQNSYFGQTQSPYFIAGTYAPSQDWSLWSGVSME